MPSGPNPRWHGGTLVEEHGRFHIALAFALAVGTHALAPLQTPKLSYHVIRGYQTIQNIKSLHSSHLGKLLGYRIPVYSWIGRGLRAHV